MPGGGRESLFRFDSFKTEKVREALNFNRRKGKKRSGLARNWSLGKGISQHNCRLGKGHTKFPLPKQEDKGADHRVRYVGGVR